MKYTAVSADGKVLRSDGVVVSLTGRLLMTPPEGLAYTAISHDLALRSDGVLRSSVGVNCPDALDPDTGLRYTAVSSPGSYHRWVALRSDGALVYCSAGVDGSSASVIEPPAGTRFVGAQMGSGEAVAATADGRVISVEAGQLAVAPTGRSIVSLATMGYGQGAAALDDGTILSWGLSSRNTTPPALPSGRDVFSVVASGDYDAAPHWAIMVGDPVPVEVSVKPSLPADRPLRVTDTVRLDVSAALTDETPVIGRAETTMRAPDGQIRKLEPRSTWPDSAAVHLMTNDHEQAGTHIAAVTFAGSPYVTTTIKTPFDFTAPSPVALTTSGPMTWHRGADDTLCFTLATEDGSPYWWRGDGQATISVEGDSSQIHKLYGYSGDTRDTWCISELSPLLRPGTYAVRFDYEGWGEADSAVLSSQIVVLPATRTRIESDLPSSWHYGEMPVFIEVDVLSDSRVPAGEVGLYLNEHSLSAFGYRDDLDGNGHGRIATYDEGELVPGTYPTVLRFRADGGFLDSRLDRTVTVKPAVFTTTEAAITGTAKVGSTLTAVPGTWSPAPTSYRYVWKVDDVAVPDATSSTFTVPASAAGKTVTVTVTGLKQYYESSATSAPTAAVAPGTFVAPLPAVTGTAKVGMTLTVNRGTWSPVPSAVQYVWKADGVTIATQATSAFVVPASASGKRLTVTVVGSGTGYTTKSVTSGQTATIAPGTFTAPRPTISGTTRVGSTLTVSRGTWSPAPSSVNYVWKADGAYLETRRDNRFVIPSGARGKHLTVTVVGSRTGYTTKSAASYRTAAIR
ncbi:hypothetical protein [Promicromonospora sp. NPDC023805]|uniref:hypothetical protein n=1 Tax=Promicromonospora sp. NPDC023805 TaxID=3154696 RepID=UPI0033C99B55